MSDQNANPVVFAYEGPAELFCQEGGYAAPGLRLDEPEGGVGFFTQMTNGDSDLVSQLADFLTDGKGFGETLALGRVTIRIEVEA